MNGPRKKPHREYVENGVRMVQLEPGGEPFVVADDLALFVSQLPVEGIADPVKRDALAAFQARYRSGLMPPAVAYREAVALLGDAIPEDFRTLRPRPVKGGAA